MTKEWFKQKFLQQKPYGIISAFTDPPTTFRSDTDAKLWKISNRVEDAHLLSYLATLDGVEIFPIRGYWQGNQEDSYLVFGIRLLELIRLAKRFDQSYVIFNGDLYSVDTIEKFNGLGIDWMDSPDTSNSSAVEMDDGDQWFRMEFHHG